MYCDLFELTTTGCTFTWSNKQDDGDKVVSKIDRTFINAAWLDKKPESFVNYPPPWYSDHCPGIISFCHGHALKPKPFMFFDMWCKDSNFIEVVNDVWKC